MGTVANLVIKLDANTGEYVAALKDAEKQTGGFASRLGGVGETALGVFTGGMITSAVGGITSSMSGLVTEMVNGNAQFERYETQFGVLLGSTDAAKQRLAELADFGAKTPFELPTVVEADKILQGFGLHSEEAAEKFGFSGEQIRTIAGDVAAGTGAGFDEMSLLLGKFSSGATGEAISRMQELGITTRDELAAMGLEFDKSGALTSPLPESMTTVLEVMQKKYGGMMDAQSGTFEGMMSNLNDWKDGTIRKLGEPIFELVGDKLQGLLTFLSSPEVQAGINSFADALASGIGTAIDTITTIMGNVQAFWTTNGPAIMAAVTDVWNGIVAFINDPVIPIFNAILTAAGTVAAWFADNWPAIRSTIETVLQGIVAFINDPVIPVIKTIMTVAGEIVTWVVEHWPEISAVIKSVLDGVVAFINDPVIPVIKTIMTVAGEIVSWFVTNWPEIRTNIETVLNGVVSFVKDPVITTIKTLIDAGKAVIDWFTNNWSGLKTKIEEVLKNITDLFTNLPEQFIAFGKGIIDGLIKGIEQNLSSFKSMLFGWLPDWAKKYLGIASPSKLFMYYGQMSALGYMRGWGGTFESPTIDAMGMAAGALPALRGAAAGAGEININFNRGVSVRSEADIRQLAYEVARVLVERS